MCSLRENTTTASGSGVHTGQAPPSGERLNGSAHSGIRVQERGLNEHVEECQQGVASVDGSTQDRLRGDVRRHDNGGTRAQVISVSSSQKRRQENGTRERWRDCVRLGLECK